jgi:hypothetical protein
MRRRRKRSRKRRKQRIERKRGRRRRNLIAHAYTKLYCLTSQKKVIFAPYYVRTANS